MNYVKVDYIDDWFYEDVDFSIKFLGDRYSIKDLDDAVFELKDQYIEMSDILKVYPQYVEEYYEDEGGEDGTGLTFDEFSTADHYDTYYLLSNMDEDELVKVLNSLGLKFGTAGYSSWSYYVALDSVPDNFINDFYEGNHWYTLYYLNDEGDIIDTISGVYLPEVTDLKPTVLECFGDEPFKVIYSEESRYFKDVEFVKVN